VPSRATMQVGDARLFDVLQELTKPKVQVERVWRVPEIAGGQGQRAADALR
jgi:hypothetical protein